MVPSCLIGMTLFNFLYLKCIISEAIGLNKSDCLQLKCYFQSRNIVKMALNRSLTIPALCEKLVPLSA